ncbi:uncharacterized protein LOC128239886 [Mya arenaria]|uniref:uncharacterized protein LOC128239886 n=1 Tax=Mya arenaria TaxID=6604 RepID=UPI0022E72A03|nr:uncharacterized protein LOC128239886 [Mya arenaria]
MLFGGAVVLLALGFHAIHADEPKCLSRFDYDEKMLLKLLRIEKKLEHIELFIQDMKSVELENLKQTDQQLQMEMNVLQDNMATTAEHSNQTETLLNDNISITNASMSLLQTQTKTLLKDCQDNISMMNASMGLLQKQMNAERGPIISFLVTDPKYESDILIFSSELLNNGNAFTPETGEFLAPLSGLYYFSFNLLAPSSNTRTYCRLFKNRYILDLYAYPDGTTSSFDSASMSAFITLKKGDVFHVGRCGGAPSVSFDRSTTLTGALIKVDYV